MPRLSRPAGQFRARPHLESLEGRDQPSSLTDDPTPPDPAPLDDPIMVTNAPPQIVNFNAEQVGNGLYIFTGQVIDEAPGGRVVTFGGGVPTVAGQTVVTNTDGTFSLTIRLRTDGTDTGTVSVTTVDAQGLPSNEALVYVSPTP